MSLTPLLKRFGEARNALASDSLKVLQATARERRNVFEELIEAVKYNSLGQISHALYEVGGSIGGICDSDHLVEVLGRIRQPYSV